MTTTQYPFTIDHLTRNGDGCWTAQLNVYGETVAVDRRFGSWRITPEVEGPYTALALRYSTALQKLVRQLERAERKETGIWTCSHCGPHPDSSRNWCAAGCGSDYHKMTSAH